MKKSSLLKAGVAPLVLGLGLGAAPVFAQDASSSAACDGPSAANNPDCATESEAPIIVTGSILRTTKEDANPVTVIKVDDLNTRGVTTVEEAIQNLAANGAGTLPNSFTANGAFAAGASAASLRGLTTSSTLVLFDGMRAAYYPLADDGTRNFVDLNTIPDAVVDTVDVLKDGASSTYGADAIAGVVNIITKKQIQGLHLGLEAGLAEGGYGAQKNMSLTYGHGDLEQDGFNIYVSGRYYKSDIIYNRDLDSLYASGNGVTQLGLPSNNYNNIYEDGSFNGLYGLTNGYFYSRPYSDTATAAGGYELLNPALGCGNDKKVNFPAGEQPSYMDIPFTCEYDLYGNFGVIQPNSERFNGTIRATAKLNDDIEAYLQVNYAQSDVSYDYYNASAIRASAPAASGITFNPNPLFLPIYLCADAAPINNQPWNNGCTAANGTLNPNNPYAADGQYARVLGQLPDITEFSRYKTESFRGAFGVNGSFGDGWYFDVGGTAMKVSLDRTLEGRVYIANFLQAVADGSYNFVNPSENSQEVRDFIAPTIYNRSTSEMYQLQGTLSRDLMELPGGALTVGVGASIRHESVNAPGADGDNSADPNLVDPTQRYTSRVNPFGSSGSRTVWSVYGEAKAPFSDYATLTLSGRYDSYNTGQDYFSPKAGLEITPIPQLKLRGTYSRGFRIGSFAEFGATPTTGYINGTGTIPDNIKDLYAAANGGTAPSYITNYSLGLTQEGNPSLAPEKSRAFTLGLVTEPVRGFSFSVDYWDIKKTDLITGADYIPALEAYYAGQPIPDGFTVIADDPSTDPALAGLLPRVQFVTYSFTNKDSARARGIDIAAAGTFQLAEDVTFTSSLEASRLLELSQTVDGVTQEYAGSIGPYVITAGSGSPKWRGSWQNTLNVDKFFISGTVYYTDGYSTSAEDVTGEGTREDCDASNSALYADGTPYQCRVGSFTYGNIALGWNVNQNFTFYVNINNVTNEKAPIDTATYGGYLYNPSWASAGIMGRYFKVGVKANF